MENYICIDGKRTELSAEQVNALRGILPLEPVRLSELAAGDCFMVGPHEMVVLEQLDGAAAVILKALLADEEAFGNRNNYDGSNVEKVCDRFAADLAAFVGEDGILDHEVDLTSDDGLKDYGSVRRRASLLTADQYRRYVEILDGHNVDAWWWLATPYSTKRHENDRWVKCVAPSGYILNCLYGIDGGVRPFCILKSDIFVSR